MPFKLLDSISAAGDPARANDDAYTLAPGLALVLDGATGLGGKLLGGPSDAAWFARSVGERLAHHTPRHHGIDLLRASLADVEAAFIALRSRAPIEMYELPMASLMLLQASSADALNAFWYGDCSALVQAPGQPLQIVGKAFERRSAEAREAATLRDVVGVSPTGNHHQPEVLAALRASRNRYNATPDGDWIFAPDIRCAEHAASTIVNAPFGTVALLATDGFLALATDYRRYDAKALLAGARRNGLHALLRELREIEAGDPKGDRFPRYKRSDDATALLIEVV